MMKKVWFMLVLTCIFASCNDGGSEELELTPKPDVVIPEITIDSNILSNGLSFGTEQGETSISFSTNVNWTLNVSSTTSGVTWCKASVVSGNKGTATVKFTVTENISYEDRSVSVTIKAGTLSKTFTITQKGVDALLVTTNKYELSQEGGQIEIEVKANIEYQMQISEAAKEWITEVDSKSRSLTTFKHKLDVAMNENVDKREGEITFKSGDKVETVKVYQVGGAILLLSQNEYTVSDAGDIISVDIKSNIEFGVQMPDVDWINDEASSRGMSSHTLNYYVAPNESYDIRSTDIIFFDKNSDLQDTLKVIQTQKNAIIISQKTYDIKAEGETIEVKVSANVDFEITMPEVNWIEQVSSRALKDHTLFFKVEENTSNDYRKSEIKFTNQDRNIYEQVEIKQQGKPKIELQGDLLIATLSKAGTLRQVLGDYFPIIFSLKIIGPINGDDIYSLRKILGGREFSESSWGRLTTLDLSEAKIVEGGDWYITTHQNHYTSNNIIGQSMFSNCSKLEHIILPTNVKAIESSAFMNCTSLNSIVMPDNLTTIGEDAFSGCEKLISIIIPNGISIIEEGTFSGCSSLETVTLPEKLISIGDNAFSHCYSLSSLVIPDNIESIGREAFWCCRSLTFINIPDKISSIAYGTFYDCALSSVTIPISVKSIEPMAFANNTLHNIYISDLSAWCRINFNGNWMMGNGSWKIYLNNKCITELTIPADVKEINKFAFNYCELSQVNIHDNITSIGEEAFSCCGLRKVTIGKECKNIKKNAFSTNDISECYCYATIPPNLYKNSFSEGYSIIGLKKKLYVPTRCRNLYMLTEWNDCFDDIIEMD